MMDGSPSTPDELRALGIELECVPCALCRSNEYERVLIGGDRLHERPGRFQVVRCSRCGLMRTNPRPTIGCIGHYYPPEYEPYLDTASEERNRWRHLASRLLDSLDVAVPSIPPGDLLEIGAASGNYLLAMQRSGWRVTGVEFDVAAAATAARRTGARVLSGDLLGAVFPEQSFDLICGWMVFEHLHNPVSALRNSFGWLKPGGWMAFSVPDAGSWQFRVFRDAWFALQLPTHLYHFTRSTLREILRNCGFVNVLLQSQRTLFDVGMSCAYILEDRGVMRPGTGQRVARSTATRALARGGGVLAGPLGLTGRLTVWAQRPALQEPR